MLRLTRRGLETGFRVPRQPSTLPVRGVPGNRHSYRDFNVDFYRVRVLIVSIQ
jgi:hypothetical protein